MPAPPYEPSRFPPATRAPRLVQTLRLQRDPIGTLLAARAELGPVFTLRVLPYEGLVCAADATTNREVLTDGERFAGGDAAKLLEPIVGPGSLILTNAPRHLRNRKLLLPPFHGERVARWGDRVRELVAREAGTLCSGAPVAVRPWAQRLALDVILRVVFGLEDRARTAAFREALDALTAPRVQALLVAPGPLLATRRPRLPGGALARRRAAVARLLVEEIATRRAAPDLDERDDVLSVLLGARDDHGRGLSDAELLDELTGLVVAGHETTATALAWTLHLLAHEPAARDALVDDLDAGSDVLLRATTKEAMRLRPPVWDAVRTAVRDTELAGRPVPAGALVSATFTVTHRDPELWDAPEAFRPGRHLDGTAPYALTPFGGGVRRCIGAALAQLELEVVLRELLATHVPEPAGPPEPARLLGVTIVPGDGGRVVLRPRTRSAADVRAPASVSTPA